MKATSRGCWPPLVRWTVLSLAGGLAGGCTPSGQYQPDSMWNGSRLRPMESGAFPGGLSSARPLPPGTMAVGTLRPDSPLATGRQGKQLLARLPVPVTPALLRQGQEQFTVFCSPCHGALGDGKGMVVRRGFPSPPDYAIARLRQAPDGHFFDVMTHGYGVMYSYADRVPVADRWAIVAYIRLLQARRPVVSVPSAETRPAGSQDAHPKPVAEGR